MDLRFPVGRPEDLSLYRNDTPVGPIAPVDLVENARFHAQKVELTYAELLARREEHPGETTRRQKEEKPS